MKLKSAQVDTRVARFGFCNSHFDPLSTRDFSVVNVCVKSVESVVSS